MRAQKLLMALILSGGSLFSQTGANELVRFLEGEWDHYGFSVVAGVPVEKQEYRERMEIRDSQTLSITAFDYLDGKDITRDMTLIVDRDEVVMQQGNFRAEGRKEGNVYYLSGKHEEKEYRFRLYTLGDKYVFHREVWANGQLENIDMSYLVRRE